MEGLKKQIKKEECKHIESDVHPFGDDNSKELRICKACKKEGVWPKQHKPFIKDAPQGPIQEAGKEMIDLLCGKCAKPKKPKVEEATKPAGGYCNCGRPTDYTPELLAKAREYAGVKMPFTAPDGIQEFVHTIAGLASFIDVTRDTVRVWAKDEDKEEFSAIVDSIMKKQERNLVAGGLSERFSGSISKLMLTKHGYHDKTENINIDVPVDPTAKEASDKAIKEYLSDKK